MRDAVVHFEAPKLKYHDDHEAYARRMRELLFFSSPDFSASEDHVLNHASPVPPYVTSPSSMSSGAGPADGPQTHAGPAEGPPEAKQADTGVEKVVEELEHVLEHVKVWDTHFVPSSGASSLKNWLKKPKSVFKWLTIRGTERPLFIPAEADSPGSTVLGEEQAKKATASSSAEGRSLGSEPRFSALYWHHKVDHGHSPDDLRSKDEAKSASASSDGLSSDEKDEEHRGRAASSIDIPSMIPNTSEQASGAPAADRGVTFDTKINKGRERR
ncbi:unnamed protein product, partial [Amoebophrya sp. A25]|eukprot:GSA25T00016038001.1